LSDPKEEKDASAIDGKKAEKPESKAKSLAKIIGPGVITGASDDDPSGIATYSQAGAKFGAGFLWMAVFQYPLMSAIQEMCARIGLVTGNGLAAVMASKYSKKIILPISVLLLAANAINIGADIAAMAASVRLIFPQVPYTAASVAFAALVILALIAIPYRKYVRVLKYLTLFLFAYVITAAIVGGKWDEILVASVVPHIEFNAEFAMLFVAIFGTTISPYLFFWQASEEAEEDVDKGKKKEIDGPEKPRISRKEIRIMKADVLIGMGFSQLIMWSIVVTTAGSLHANGITDITTVEQAAKALEPLVNSFPYSGTVSKSIFALGVIGTGLLSIPVLAGASGYAVADVFGWKQGLDKKFGQAKSFYTVIAASVIIGLSINFLNVDPVQALVYSAVINATVSVPILFVLLKIANDKKILGNKVNGRTSNILGWLTFAIMAASVCVMFAAWAK
jgi:NRAMP (natural resistance-associated macrophage protein)-like metal ion transporter